MQPRTVALENSHPKPEPAFPFEAPLLSVVVPVLGEGPQIRRRIQGLLKLGPPGLVEILVVDGDPSASTVLHLENLENRGLRLLTASKGRARQMDAGARAAAGEWLLFLHSDTRLPPGALARIADVLGTNRARVGAFSLRLAARHPWLRLLAWASTWRSRLSGIPYGDQAIFLRRTDFFALGGYGEMPLLEDVDLMERAKAHGWRAVILPQAAIASARAWKIGGLVRVTLRHRLVMALHALGVPAEKLARLGV